MKTKSLILAAAALVLAVGGAFASLLAPKIGYIEYRTSSAPNTWVCQQTSLTCNNSGEGTVCTIRVNLDTPTDFEDVVGTDADCASALTHTSAAPRAFDPLPTNVIDAQ